MTRPFAPRLVAVGNAGPYTGAGNNTYLLAGGDGEATLIDAGIGSQAHTDVLAAALADAHASLAQVLVTHAHLDHASGAPTLAARFGVSRFAKYVWPEGDVAGVEWAHLPDGAAIEVGATRLVALHTPGHSPDHLAFWHEPTRSLFSGDLVNAQTTVAIIHSRGGNLAQYLASLERLLALAPARLLPGHGPIIENPAQVLQMTLTHRRTRERQVLAAVVAGHDSVQTITESIYDGLSPELMPLARENVRAHLEKLRDDGRVAVDGDRWRPPAQ